MSDQDQLCRFVALVLANDLGMSLSFPSVDPVDEFERMASVFTFLAGIPEEGVSVISVRCVVTAKYHLEREA